MSRSLNKVELIGRLGKDPELKYTTSGKAVANFSIATSEEWKDENGKKQERTDWHNVQAWGKLAEICGEYLKKGSQVYIDGTIHTRSYEDKSGVKRYVTEIVIQKLLMLGSGKGLSNEEADDQSTLPIGEAHQLTAGASEKDDLPF